MKYYRIEMDWDTKGDSPWDRVWQESPEPIDCLNGSLPLAAIWRSPKVWVEKGTKSPDVYGFELHFAVTERLRDLLERMVRDEAEFLPLVVPDVGVLFLIHPLWPVDFDDAAQLQRNGVSGNITVVQKYSFTLDPDAYEGPRHLFRMRQAKGSAARDAGCCRSELIVSEKVKRAAEVSGVAGIVFKYVCSA